MSDKWVEEICGPQNDIMSRVLGYNGSKKYIHRDEWKEEKIYEEFDDKLEKDLEDYRTMLENEHREFEEKINNNNGFIDEKTLGSALIEMISYQSTESSVNLKIEGFQNNPNNTIDFCIIKNEIDIIRDIYLEIYLGESIFELSLEQKYALIDTKISLNVGSRRIIYSSILDCIFFNIISGRNIKENDNVIQIPIFNFDTFELEPNKKIGLYVLALALNIDVHLHFDIFNSCLRNFKYKLLVNGTVIHDRIDLFNKIRYSNKEYMRLNSQYIKYHASNNNYICKMFINHVVKCILIYFAPDASLPKEYESTNNITDDNTDNMSSVKSIKISTNNKIILDFEGDDLLDFEIFGIKIYLLPLCKEFSDWERIYECFKKVHKKISVYGINFSMLSKASLEVKLDDYLQNNNTILVLSAIYFDAVRFWNGMLVGLIPN